MEELIGRVTGFIAAHGMWAGPLMGLLTFGESLAIVGLFIPATTLMIAVGGLIGAGTLAPIPIILWSIAGALAGDWLSYAIGRRIGPSVYRRWPLNCHRLMVARTRLFFRRFGFVSVLVGRFLGPVRATIPLVAGVMQMDARPFQIANFLSAIVWVPALLAPGMLAARTLGPMEQINAFHLAVLAATSLLFTAIATVVAARVLGNDRKRKHRRLGQVSKRGGMT
jgi:membrane protein DedA with SNARE-associated domain